MLPGDQAAGGEPRDRSPLAEPFAIGHVALPNRVVLAPMAGLTSSCYRRHMKAHGVGLVMSEMVSAYGLIYGNVRTGGYLDFAEEERPIAVQLFGDDPDAMARATEIMLSRAPAPDLVDINMGCPVRKVAKTGAGVSLMGDPDRAVAVAAAVVRAAAGGGSSGGVEWGRRSPVTVKLRGGLVPGDGLAVALAPRLEEVGVAALGVHPRAASEYYHGRADHRVTAAVVGAVGIPVMASGDIDSVESAIEVVETTGAAAVMVARGVSGNPWLVGALLSGRRAARPPLDEVVEDLRRLLRGAEQEMGSERASRWIRKLLTWYLRPSGVSPRRLDAILVLTETRAIDEALAGLTEPRR
jgi:tRNA-dihydrouridine synthase B